MARNSGYGFTVLPVLKSVFPTRELIEIKLPDGKNMTIAIFGPDSYKGNLKTMQEPHTHSSCDKIIYFEPLHTEDSIEVLAALGGEANPFLKTGVQIGTAGVSSVRTYVNLPRDEQGNFMTNRVLLSRSIKPANDFIGRGYVNSVSDVLRYADNITFREGQQSAQTFLKGGLAKILSGNQTSQGLRTLTSRRNYPDGIYITGFSGVYDDKAIVEFGAIRLRSNDEPHPPKSLIIRCEVIDQSGYAFARVVEDKNRSSSQTPSL